MSDDAVDYSGTSESDSESDKVPSRLQLERNRAFWRMISASFTLVSDAQLQVRRRNRRAPSTRYSENKQKEFVAGRGAPPKILP